MTKLSVNINKVATIRNARGGNTPNVKQFAIDCERFGAQGITVHPRPDERHIRYSDVYDIKPIVTTEFNIEGNPKGISKSKPYGFIDLVKETGPTQVTLVPDAEGVLTSNAGWDTVKNQQYLCDVVKEWSSTPRATHRSMPPGVKPQLPPSSRPQRWLATAGSASMPDTISRSRTSPTSINRYHGWMR